MLNVVNPINREPENMETASYLCACVCYSDSNHDPTNFGAWLPITEDCRCGCYPNNTANSSANFNLASAQN